MLKVLIAEDELMIADQLEETLVMSGFDVCGIARTVEEAVALAEMHKPELAVFDVRLARGGRRPEIVEKLRDTARSGILYATGDDIRHSTLMLADGDAAITKPYRTEDVARALSIVHEIVTAGTATPPFPPSFRLLPESAGGFAQRTPE
jgi:DNA-binding response OmpR family regulator